MLNETITYAVQDAVAVVTLNRPEVKNALNTQMRAEITHAVQAAGDEARVLVITGATGAFCSGQDLGGNVSAATLDVERVLHEEYEPMLQAIHNNKIPTIAAVNGVAAGAGASLALAADVVIAAESALFIQAFTRIGLMPDAGGTYALPRQVGLARAMGASLFGDAIPAAQAAQWGMIYESVADDKFAAHWQARAQHLAQGPTVSYSSIKEALHASATNSLEQQLALEARLQGRCGKTHDFREGVTAFLEKRPAKFEGR